MNPQLKPLLARAAGALFWTWNTLFVVFVSFGLFPTVLLHLVAGAARGEVAPDFAAFSLVLATVPPAAMLLAWFRLRGNGFAQLELLYGVEGPLMVLCLFRLFLFRELTPATIHLGMLTLVGLAAYLVALLTRREPRTRAVATGRLALQSTHLLIALYACVLLSFFFPPALHGFIDFILHDLPAGLREITYSIRLEQMFFLGVGLPLLTFSGSLLLGLPAALIVLGLLEWSQCARRYSTRFGIARAALTTAAVVALNVGLFVHANRQPQQEAFALLATPPTTAAARAKLVSQADVLRDGLLNAYLSPYRYLATTEEAGLMRNVYERQLHFSPASAAKVQAAFDSVARPFLYVGHDVNTDRRKAEELYERFFDEPIQKAERAAVNHALSSTYQRATQEAGHLDTDARTVLVERQELVVTPHGAHAEVELHEVYRNQTMTQQEVLYHFTLPEGAVVTGLWLGDDDDRRMRFPFTVAAKGAARRVYRQQLERRADPALLEQVGPSSYRLRAFPIPPRVLDVKHDDARMHLWLTYETFAQDGAWPLPQLVEKRNAYWDDDSVLTVDGAATRRTDDSWLPARIAARAAIPAAAPFVAQVGAHRIAATPRSASEPSSFAGLRLAVVVDGSYSMHRHETELAAAVRKLGADVDWFVTGESPRALRGGTTPTGEDLAAFGDASPARILGQFATLAAKRSYDAVLVLTDDAGYDRRDASAALPALPYPIVLVHLGGALPPAYDESLFPALQRLGGGAVRTLDAAARLLSRQKEWQRGDVVGVDALYVWTAYAESARRPQSSSLPELTTFADAETAHGAESFAAARLLGHRLARGDAPDTLHAVAVAEQIVTPMSSMLVLVNDQQRAALAAAAARADAFSAEAETGKEFLSTPFNDVSATPEPEEWLLLTLCVALLAAHQLRLSPSVRRQKLV